MAKTPKIPGSSFETDLARDLRNPQFRRAYLARRALHDLARAVARLREAKHLSQGDLAALLETAQSSISRFESGKDTRMPRLDTLTSIADALGMGLRLVFVERPKGRKAATQPPVEVPARLVGPKSRERRRATG